MMFTAFRRLPASGWASVRRAGVRSRPTDRGRTPRTGGVGMTRPRNPCLLSLAACLAFLGLPFAGSPLWAKDADTCVDVALVLAIDASGSIDEAEFTLQMTGYAAALRDGNVRAAITEAGRVKIAVVVWGDSDFSSQVIPFQRISGAAEADALAVELAFFRREVAGNTGLANGLSIALDLLDDPSLCATRRVVDVSGDGKQAMVKGRYPAYSLPVVRERAKQMGVTINALAIETEVADLGDYFDRSVTVGPDSFVMRIRSLADFRDAIVEKLRRELVASGPARFRPTLSVHGAG